MTIKTIETMTAVELRAWRTRLHAKVNRRYARISVLNKQIRSYEIQIGMIDDQLYKRKCNETASS